jgi:hypothetical protein
VFDIVNKFFLDEKCGNASRSARQQEWHRFRTHFVDKIVGKGIEEDQSP